MGKVLQRVVHVGSGFGIFTNYNVIELATGIVLKNGTDYKGRGASLKIFTKYTLGLGKR